MEHQAEGTATPLTWREQLAVKIEGCLAEMDLANRHMAQMLNEIQEHLFNEGRAVTREKATERMRAKIPEPQTTLEKAARGTHEKGGP